MYGKGERYIQGFGGKTWGKETASTPRGKWDGNIKMDIRDVGWGSMDWIDMTQDKDR